MTTTDPTAGVPLPGAGETDLSPPDRATTEVVAAAVMTALGGPDRLSPLHDVLVEALFRSMTGHAVPGDPAAVDPRHLALALA